MVGGVDDEELDALVRRVDAAADGATTALTIRDRLGINPDDKDTRLAALDIAFSYYERHDGSGYNYFGPLFEVGGQSFPPLPNDTPDEIRAVWEALAERVHDPAARARLHDLCFVTGRGNRRDHAQAAAEAYLEVAARYPLVPTRTRKPSTSPLEQPKQSPGPSTSHDVPARTSSPTM